MKRRADPTSPNDQVLHRRIGKWPLVLRRLRELCASDSRFENLLPMIDRAMSGESVEPEVEATDSAMADGWVYLSRMKVGRQRYFKIGFTNDPARRHREIGSKLPEELETIHVIRTDDPSGIEAYWHRRFESKRTQGEWYKLSHEDVRAFKRRRSFM